MIRWAVSGTDHPKRPTRRLQETGGGELVVADGQPFADEYRPASSAAATSA
jgi:hypothetical protein